MMITKVKGGHDRDNGIDSYYSVIFFFFLSELKKISCIKIILTMVESLLIWIHISLIYSPGKKQMKL